jgi:DNA polymerase-3 subunit epsilon
MCRNGRLSFDEADSLLGQARMTRLTGTQLRDLHEDAWNSAFPAETAVDWTTLTPIKRSEMFLLAEALGLSDVADKMGAVIRSLVEPEPPPEARYLRALRVGIVGDDPASAALRDRGEAYGAVRDVHRRACRSPSRITCGPRLVPKSVRCQ